MPSFNLIDEPWITCVDRNGTRRDVSLRVCMASAHELREITHSSPLVVLALHRLLLAILHRCFGPAGERAWGELFRAARFDSGVLDDYWGRCNGSFDLFDARRPFYQSPGLDVEGCGVSAAKLCLERASGNNATLFDHSHDDSPPWLSAAESARRVVAVQAYAVGGLVSLQKGEPKANKAAKAGPLFKGAAVLVMGESLFETLLLNAVRYDPARGKPFRASGSDLPAWEQPSACSVETRAPQGYLDYLTWQSRRVLLLPEQDASGLFGVRRVALMKGREIPDDGFRHAREPMVAFRAVDKPRSGQDPRPAVGLVEGRELWRDSGALLAWATEDHRPRVVQWLSELMDAGELNGREREVSCIGVCADKAKIHFWRAERLPLPARFLKDSKSTAAIVDALDAAGRGAWAVDCATRRLAAAFVAPAAACDGNSGANKNGISDVAAALGAKRLFWAALEIPFRRLLSELGAAGAEHAPLLEQWRGRVAGIARTTLASCGVAAGESARALRGMALAETTLAALIAKI